MPSPESLSASDRPRAQSMEPGEPATMTIIGVVGGFLVTFCLGAIVLAFATSGFDDATATATDSDPVLLLSGERVYVAQCARCHGAEGEGGIGVPIGGGLLVEKYPDIEAQIDVIANGRRAMPGFGTVLSAEEIESVARYEREQLGR